MNILLSFDVEHWDIGFKYRGIKGLDEDRSRDNNNIDKILILLEEHKSKATFFTTGQYAEDYPDIVRSIYDEGHEIACHGYSHEYIYNQTPAKFKEETILAREILTNLTNESPTCYRAASWSIVRRSLWALKIIQEVGFLYDSSIYPTINYKYGIYNAPSGVYKIKISDTKSIIELTPQTLSFFGIKLPVANGVYMRLFPNWFSKLSFNLDNKKGLPGRAMLHPHEMDANPPKLSVPLNFWLIRYFRIKSVKGLIQRILDEYNCMSYKQFYSTLNYTKLPVVDIKKL